VLLVHPRDAVGGRRRIPATGAGWLAGHLPIVTSGRQLTGMIVGGSMVIGGLVNGGLVIGGSIVIGGLVIGGLVIGGLVIGGSIVIGGSSVIGGLIVIGTPPGSPPSAVGACNAVLRTRAAPPPRMLRASTNMAVRRRTVVLICAPVVSFVPPFGPVARSGTGRALGGPDYMSRARSV
jgi:hypothetical protein